MRPPSLKSADFLRALGSRPVSRTTHFVLHALWRPQVNAVPVPGSDRVSETQAPKLSTSDALVEPVCVDDCTVEVPGAGPRGWRLGLVLPKKQARRSVTRSLIRHQSREALRRHAPQVWAKGRFTAEVEGWVVRLRAPFDRQLFPSAASEALNAAVRAELDELWSRLSRGQA